MRKFSNLRIEVLTGILAAAVLAGVIIIGGLPSIGVAQGATAFKDGFHALSAAVTGKDKAKEYNNDLFQQNWVEKAIAQQKGSDRFDHCKGRVGTAAVAVQREDEQKAGGCCPFAGKMAGLNDGSGCKDGKKSGGDKHPAPSACPFGGDSVDTPSVTDKPQAKLAMAE
jgi:hypothetical protein